MGGPVVTMVTAALEGDSARVADTWTRLYPEAGPYTVPPADLNAHSRISRPKCTGVHE